MWKRVIHFLNIKRFGIYDQVEYAHNLFNIKEYFVIHVPLAVAVVSHSLIASVAFP